MTFMTGYQSMEGVPSTANHWLLTEVLKDEWGFKGILVTDWDNVGRLVYEQKVCADYVEAAVVAVRAGNDMMMTTPQFFEGAIEAVRTGKLAESEIDAPCARLLALKFRMGLFENPRRPIWNRQPSRSIVPIIAPSIWMPPAKASSFCKTTACSRSTRRN